MPAINVLHASDIHLAKVPQRRSILDRASVTKKVMNDLLGRLKGHLLSGELTNLKEALKGTFSEASIALLETTQTLTDREQRDQLNRKIDQVLYGLVLSDDPIFRDFIADITRKVSFATSYNPLALDSLVNFILSQDNLRAVMLSGDIATTGFEHDLRKAKEFLEGTDTPANPLASDSTLGNLSIPVWILPGNHDRYTYTGKEWFFSPGGTLFNQILNKHWAGRVKSYIPLRDTQEALSVLILAADFNLQKSEDSTLPHRFNKLAQGKVYEEILEELEKETKEQKQKERNEFPHHQLVVLWALHFPPFFPGLGTAKSLLKAEDLIDKAEDLKVNALLAGHTHEAEDYYALDRVRVLCAGTPTQHDSATKHCQIISVSRGASGGTPSISLTEYEWDKENVTFKLMEKKNKR